MNGKIVRLSRGEAKTAKVYEQFGSPLDAAKRWRDEGASKLHIIDLDAAFGKGNNHEVIGAIAGNIALPIQAGGGIRSYETAEKLFKAKISQVILGALAFSDPSAISKIQQRFGEESVIVALDNSHGKVMVEGWKTSVPITMEDALEKFTELGVNRYLVTSIVQDGTLQGPDIEILKQAVKFPKAKIIAAGGIGSLDDLTALKGIGVEGVVIGKALYEGKFTLREAIKRAGA
jgi:phosphoribosylformimino-5-aminoimidazole carboxamide ribotide isomerase